MRLKLYEIYRDIYTEPTREGFGSYVVLYELM